MNFLKKNLNGILVCFVIAVPSWLLGKTFPVVGGPVIAILAGMLITLVWTNKGKAESGIKWTSKIILQTAVVLLGFGMNLGVILQTGKQSLPIIVCTISTSLIIAWLLRKIIKVPSNTSIPVADLRLIGDVLRKVCCNFCNLAHAEQPLIFGAGVQQNAVNVAHLEVALRQAGKVQVRKHHSVFSFIFRRYCTASSVKS